MYANSKKTICAWCLGVTQQRNGVDNVSMIVNLLLVGGNIGRPGAGTVCIRGHSNVQGDRTMGIWERPPKAFLDALAKEFNFDPPKKWGYDTVETLHAMFNGDIKVFFAVSGNFLSNTPDTVYTAHAQKCRLTAVAAAARAHRQGEMAKDGTVKLGVFRRLNNRFHGLADDSWFGVEAHGDHI
jgi:anaerobic selenocysteine-containing dehydrogenase